MVNIQCVLVREYQLYIMDINGPVCIQHQEIHLIEKVDFEIISVSFSNQYPFYNYGIAIGKSNTIDNQYNYNWEVDFRMNVKIELYV